jgi:exportin-1
MADGQPHSFCSNRDAVI